MSDNTVQKRIRQLIAEQPDQETFSKKVVRQIKAARPYYDWVGIYLAADDALRLPDSYYIGPATTHTVIPYDEGICGAAATQRQTIIVDDVNSDPRYIACSIRTKSEIVVPVMKNGTLYGVLDLDSDTPAAFTVEDRKLLTSAADTIAEFFSQAEKI